MSHDHIDDDEHGHSHAPPEDIVVRVKALENLMIKKGLVDPAAVDEIVEQYESRIGPHIGAKVVARAWSEPDYKKRLLADANTALAELDVSRLQGEDVVVVENTDNIHNVLVCTLCSCYPWNLLGLPPIWYKSTPFRSRIVKEPRLVLKNDFGLEIADDVEVRVWDANAELRYLVLPQRPQGTEGLSETELEKLVTRDSMLGTGQPTRPGA